MTRIPALLAVLLASAAALAGCTGDATASTRLVLDFPDGQADVDARVLLPDVEALGAPSAHNQLLAWAAASGADVDIEAFSFGNCLAAIDGVPPTSGCKSGAAGYWSLAVNGDVAASGMDEIQLADGDVVTWTYIALDGAAMSSSGSPGPALTVDLPSPTQEETLVLTGTLDRAARVSVPGVPAIEAQAGTWSIPVPLEHGRTNLTVTADDGQGTSQQHVLAIRLASATFEARFTMAVPPRDPISDLVWYDPDELASAPLYNGSAATHPPEANVHDLMVTWERQAGKQITYSAPASFGFGVDKIDGVGQPLSASAPPYWCYKLNGASADLGISAQPLAPGDVVTWEFAGCA